jgi:hypothetical protein
MYYMTIQGIEGNNNKKCVLVFVRHLQTLKENVLIFFLMVLRLFPSFRATRTLKVSQHMQLEQGGCAATTKGGDAAEHHVRATPAMAMAPVTTNDICGGSTTPARVAAKLWSLDPT